MRQSPATDPLDLWRGIDDAVWREATRIAPPPRMNVGPARLRGRQLDVREKPTAEAPKVREPV